MTHKFLSISMPDTMHDKIREFAHRENLSVSAAVRQLVSETLAARLATKEESHV